MHTRTTMDKCIIKNWVKTCSVQMDDGEVHYIIEDILGKATDNERAEIKRRLSVMSLALKELCSPEQTFQFFATFTRGVNDKEWEVSQPHTLIAYNEKSKDPKEEVKKALENTFHFLTDYLKNTAKYELPFTTHHGIYHSVYDEKLGCWQHLSPFGVPLILPSVEKKMEKMLYALDEPGVEKYIKVEVKEWTGEITLRTIASFEHKFANYKEKYMEFMEAVKKEERYLTDEDYREFTKRYNQCKCIDCTFAKLNEALKD